MKSKRLLKIHLTVFVLSVLLIFTESWGIQLHAQGISGHFSKSDRKDLDEASKEEVQAGELINEANSIYTEIYNSKSGQNDQKGKSKHLGNKALKKQLKAESLYESANATQYKIYKYHITKQKEESRLSPSVLNKVRLLEEQADQNYNRGQTLRQDGKKLKDDKLKYSKYTKANDYEKEALQEQLNILKIFFGDSATGTAISAPVAKPAGDETGSQSKKTLAKSDQKVVIDSVRVRAIQNKLKYISDAATFNIDSLNGLDKQSLSRAWFNYLYEADTSKYMEEANNKPQPATAERTGIAEKQQYESPLLTDKELVEKVPSHEKNEDDLSGMGQKEKNTKSLNNQSPISTQNYTNPDYSERQTVSDSTYRVQIAADRAPLSQETLRKIYSGNKNITMTQDGGWNKYSIGPFSSFEEAQKFKKSCGVKNSFITSTLAEKGKKRAQSLVKKPAQKAVQEATVQDKDQIIFRVQIAASRVPLSEKKIHHIYNGNLPVAMHREEGWYKYSIGEVENYVQARNTQKQIPVKGTFIAAYQSGRKLKLYEAIRQNHMTGSTSSKDVSFYVQIAASKNSMKQNTLKKIYSGEKKILMSRENGWYKYRIFAGETYRQAASFKRQLFVSGAFVVAYQHGKKIPLQSAISLTK